MRAMPSSRWNLISLRFQEIRPHLQVCTNAIASRGGHMNALRACELCARAHGRQASAERAAARVLAMWTSLAALMSANEESNSEQLTCGRFQAFPFGLDGTIVYPETYETMPLREATLCWPDAQAKSGGRARRWSICTRRRIKAATPTSCVASTWSEAVPKAWSTPPSGASRANPPAEGAIDDRCHQAEQGMIERRDRIA